MFLENWEGVILLRKQYCLYLLKAIGKKWLMGQGLHYTICVTQRVCIQCCYVLMCSVPFSSVAQTCLTQCDPKDCSTPGLPVHHQLLELAQTQVHWVGDDMQPSHPLSSPSPPTCNLPQYQGLFQLVSSSHQVAKVLEFQLQHQSFQWILRTDFLGDWLVGSPCSSRDSQESSPTPQFKSINSSVFNFIYGPTLTSIHDYWKNQ